MKISKLIVNKYLNIYIIVFFEFSCTALFGYYNILLFNKGVGTSPAGKQIYGLVEFALSMFMCLSYGRQFSGGLYNPAITLFRMFRKTDRVPWKIGLLYIFTQFVGGMCGNCLAFWVNDLQYTDIMQILPYDQQMRRFAVEILGTVVFSIILQIIVEKRTTFIQHNRQFYLCIPLLLMTTRQYTSISDHMNPALGFGYEFGYCAYHGNWNILSMTYILTVGPWIGAIIGVICFEYGLKPLYPLKKNQIVKQIKKIQLKREVNQGQDTQKKSLITIEDIQLNDHKFSLSQIMNLQPQNQVYIGVEDDYVMIGEDQLYNNIISDQEIEEEKRRIMPGNTELREQILKGQFINQTSPH